MSQSSAGGFDSSWPPFVALLSPRVVGHAWFYLLDVWVLFVVGLDHCLFFRWFTFAGYLHLRRLSLLCCCFLFFACLFRIFASVDVLSILYRVHVCCSFGSRFARVYLMGVWWTDFRLAPIWALLSMYMNRILLVPLKTLSKVQCWTVIYVMACIQMQMKVKQCKSLSSSGSNGRSQEIIWWRSVLRNHAPCIQLQYVSTSITLKSTKSPCWYGTLRDKQNAMMLNQENSDLKRHRFAI